MIITLELDDETIDRLKSNGTHGRESSQGYEILGMALLDAWQSRPKPFFLFTVRNRKGGIESVTVYKFERRGPYPSAWGACDIVYSFGGSYMHIDNPASGFNDGELLATETMEFFGTEFEATKKAREIVDAAFGCTRS